MKSIILASLLIAGISVAQADQFQLAFINSNNCGAIQNAIRNLNTSQIGVRTFCSDYGNYPSNNGNIYHYRMTTIVNVPGPVAPGTSIRLGNILSNNCYSTRNLVLTLNTPQVRVDAECSDFGHYPSTNGNVYNYRLYTTITIQ